MGALYKGDVTVLCQFYNKADPFCGNGQEVVSLCRAIVGKIELAIIDSFTNVSYNNYRLLCEPPQTTSNAKYRTNYFGECKQIEEESL